MTTPTFPTLQGLAWPVNRVPKWDTLKQTPWSGKDTRLQKWSYPIYEFTLTFNYLSATDYANIEGFYNLAGGAAQMFQFQDANDKSVTNQGFGTGDGATTTFQLVRSFGGFVMPIFAPTGSPTIKDNGATVNPANYTINATGLVTFTAAPTAGHALTWTGNFNWLCWFTDDALSLSEIMKNIFELKKLIFESVKL